MTERELIRELNRLKKLSASKEDWLDLHETIEAYKMRCLARVIAKDKKRNELIEAIKSMAGIGG